MGAVYVVGAPLAVVPGEIVPQRVVEHDTDHVTPLASESFLTIAVNWAVESDCSVAESGEIMTEIEGRALVPELQPERSVAVRYPIAIRAIQGIFLVLPITRLLSESGPWKTGGIAPGIHTQSDAHQ